MSGSFLHDVSIKINENICHLYTRKIWELTCDYRELGGVLVGGTFHYYEIRSKIKGTHKYAYKRTPKKLFICLTNQAENITLLSCT